MEKLKSVNEVCGLTLGSIHGMNGKNNSRLGMAQMINALGGGSNYDGWKIITDENEYHILIDNGQSCCESWGYIVSENDFSEFVGKEIKDVRLTDTKLNNSSVYSYLEYLDDGGVQFVNFEFSDGSVLQFAVYNGHNGYYGHGIIIAKNEDILLSDVL